MQIVGFNLTKFQSNMKKVMDFLPTQNVSQSTVTFDKDGGNVQRILEIYWNIIDNNFFFSSNIKVSRPTNRGVLITVCTIFDQTGFLAPFILKTKLLLQSMWRLKIGWDDNLPTLQAKYWEKCIKSFFNIN